MPRDFVVQNKRERKITKKMIRERKITKKKIVCLFKFKKMIKDVEENRVRLFKFQTR